MVLKRKMDKEKSPMERLHDDIRQAVKKIEDDMDDEMVRIHTIENDDAGEIIYLRKICVQTLY